ncbi:MAG: DUF2993 domain-containing protein [Corynebacterium sp.]|uniref:LmeA family phospholipid-binding protein n=1 Tax=Corynebacterium sp. TaxID=1720 RepID=UPI0026DCBCFE|nr:DUF2993 domain-containing protein [Corynebacterium sp.]MDO4761072.1 DUF2993 domain-containing protein [Corynebacterium sp.]
MNPMLAKVFCHDGLVTAFRRPLIALATCALILGALWVGDTALAARSEKRLADTIKPQLGFSPEVYIGGFPFTANLYTLEVPNMYVSVTDARIPQFGLVRTHTELKDVTISRQQLLDGNFDNTTAALMTSQVSLDAVSIGNALNIPDLDISHPYDISPAGGSASEVTLTGTPRALGQRLSVLAELRIRGHQFYMHPTTVLDSGDNTLKTHDILDAFRWDFNTNTLPLPKQATFVGASGGTIYFQADERNVTVHTHDLYPTTTPGKRSEHPRENTGH